LLDYEVVAAADSVFPSIDELRLAVAVYVIVSSLFNELRMSYLVAPPFSLAYN